MTRLAQRAEYLSSMGVQPWYARVILGGAAPSPDYQRLGLGEVPVVQASPFVGDVPTKPVASDVVLAESVAKPANGAGSRLDASLMAHESPSLSSQVDAEIEKAQASVTLDGEAALPLACSLAVLKSEHVVVLLSGYEAGSAREQVELAEAVLKAIEPQSTKVSFSASFVWPVFSGELSGTNSAELMRPALCRFFESAGVGCARKVICFGHELSKDVVLECGGLASDVVLLATSTSLADCLQNPLAKSRVWLDLSPVPVVSAIAR